MSATEYYLQGRQGGVVLTSLSANALGPFRWIQVVNDTVLESILDQSIFNAGNLESLTLPAGLGIGGNFTDVKLTSGVVIAYYA